MLFYALNEILMKWLKNKYEFLKSRSQEFLVAYANRNSYKQKPRN